ncbi:MAG: hypothetical protein HC877_21140 [Thioploca sp.]|nr:hypothetical protein [Thioploca sp.]
MKTNIIVLTSLISSLITMGSVSELSAQEDVLWEGTDPYEEVIPDNEILEDVLWEETDSYEEVIPDNEILETEAGLTEEITDYSSDPGLNEEAVSEVIISDGNETEPIVPIEEPETSITGTQESNGEISPELTSNETSTTTQELSPNPLNPLPSEEFPPPLENPSNENGEILPSITYDPPVILSHLETVANLQPVVQPTTENVATLSVELEPAAIQAVDGECNNPATYDNNLREAHLPAVEVPLYIDITGQPIPSIGLFDVKLRIPFGYSDFELKEAVFKGILIDSDPCNAQFIPETGILSVPQVKIPTLIAAIDSTQSQVGPDIKCSAILQQSNIRITVLSLKELQCDPPL